MRIFANRVMERMRAQTGPRLYSRPKGFGVITQNGRDQVSDTAAAAGLIAHPNAKLGQHCLTQGNGAEAAAAQLLRPHSSRECVLVAWHLCNTLVYHKGGSV